MIGTVRQFVEAGWRDKMKPIRLARCAWFYCYEYPVVHSQYYWYTSMYPYVDLWWDNFRIPRTAGSNTITYFDYNGYRYLKGTVMSGGYSKIGRIKL